MGKGGYIFLLLLYKNYVSRKRHWVATIMEILMPLSFCALLLLIRSQLAMDNKTIEGDNYFDARTRDDLVHVSSSTFQIYYVPENNFTNSIMKDVREHCFKLPTNKIIGFPSEDAMVQRYMRQQVENKFGTVMAVVFDDSAGGTVPKRLEYTIRSSVAHPIEPFEGFGGGVMSLSDLFIESGFVGTQLCVDQAFIKMAAGNVTLDAEISVQKMPYPSHADADPVEVAIRDLIAVGASIAFIAIVFMEPSYISAEKNIGVNALMVMNGVRSYLNWLSWQVNGMGLSLVYVSIMTAMFKISYSTDANPCLHYGNAFIFWLSLFIHAAHTIAFCLHVAAYFTKTFFAQGAALVIYCIMIVLGHFLSVLKLNVLVPYLGILVPSVTCRRIFEEFMIYESKMVGAQWSNMFQAGNLSSKMYGSLGCLIILSLIGIIFHFLMALYIDAVLPGKYGVPKHPLFFLEFFRKNKKVDVDDDYDHLENAEVDSGRFERVAQNTLTPGIQIRNLKKTFVSGCLRKNTVKAVRGISVDFYKGQITALLGHNGAGKTTTMSIMAGLTAPSKGMVHINGRSIKEDLDAIRNDLGMCPQENMLFPNLTVFEQIEFFGMLKGQEKQRRQIKDEVDSLLKKLEISDKKNVLPSKLSGGQKRRVCLGMALIGDASVLILDEPTSGMDPETSRETWDIILGLRGQKTIIITTHSMEEADILGDRIAIMHKGKMKCYGSSMFLKKLYGHGYHEITLSTEPWCNPETVMAMVDPEAKLRNKVSGRIVLSIPYTDSLPKALDQVEARKAELGITGLSVSLITLEQIFLKVAEEEEGVGDVVDAAAPSTKEPTKVDGWGLTMQMIYALLAKKAVYTGRNMNVILAIMLCPLIAVMIMPFFDCLNTDSTTKYPLNLGVYNYPEGLVYSVNDSLRETYKKVVESQHGTLRSNGIERSLTAALLAEGRRDLGYYRNYFIVSAEFNSSEETMKANGFYSSSAALSVPITMNILSNTLLKIHAGDEYSIGIHSQALPSSLASTVVDYVTKVANNTMRTMIFVIIFFIVVGFFVIHPLLENATVFKQLQRMTGVSFSVYWGTMFFFDYLVYVASTLLILLGFYTMDNILEAHLYHGTEIAITALILLLFGMSILPMAYIHSFMNKPTNTVLLFMSLFPMTLAVVEIILSVSLKYVDDTAESTLIVQRIFSLMPQVSMSLGMMAFFDIAADNARCRRLPNRLNEVACLANDPCCGLECLDGVCKNPRSYFNGFRKDSGVEEFLIYLAVMPFVLFVILWLLEDKVFLKINVKYLSRKFKALIESPKDSDVKKEKAAVLEGVKKRLKSPKTDDENIFLVRELRKYYGKVRAVTEVNFRVKRQECFGLLGVNGAGKSTTFRMLTGEEIPSNGTLLLGHDDIEKDRKKYLAQMGYCPQTHAIIPSLNAYEHLGLMALLRGIPRSQVKPEVAKWIDRLNLHACATQPSGTYSGGNKRRLNIALSLIASPRMVLLDEPTTGVDPVARRSLWSVLQNCQAAGQAIILTSHSMEECEALCNRLVIMVKGKLVCVGASQQLKQRFGAGYDIQVKLHPGRTELELKEVKAVIEDKLVCELTDEHSGLLLYHVTDHKITWETMFGTMNHVKREHPCVEDFSVSSATLEQLFIQFVKSAKESKSDESPKKSKRKYTRV